jgi:hypothetical protein
MHMNNLYVVIFYLQNVLLQFLFLAQVLRNPPPPPFVNEYTFVCQDGKLTPKSVPANF